MTTPNTIFKLTGSYSTQPASGAPSAVPEVVSTSIDESIELVRKQLNEYTLTSDVAVSVDLTGLVVGANVLLVAVTGGKVKVRITSTDGAVQSIPCDDLLYLICRSVPITAIDITRLTGVAGINVKVFTGTVGP